MRIEKNSTAIGSEAAIADEGALAFSQYLETEAAQNLIGCLKNDLEGVEERIRLSDLAEAGGTNPDDVIEHIQEIEDFARGLVDSAINLQAGYIDHLGLISRMREAAIELQTTECDRMRNVIAEGLRLQKFSARRMPKDLLENLAALGMPPAFKGRSTRTFSGAARSVSSWLQKAGTGPA